MWYISMFNQNIYRGWGSSLVNQWKHKDLSWILGFLWNNWMESYVPVTPKLRTKTWGPLKLIGQPASLNLQAQGSVWDPVSRLIVEINWGRYLILTSVFHTCMQHMCTCTLRHMHIHMYTHAETHKCPQTKVETWEMSLKQLSGI